MSMRSLTIAGVLIDERTLRLDPSFVVDNDPTPLPEGGSESPDVILVESVGSAGELLNVTPIPTAPLCLYRSGQPAPRLAAGVVAIEENARMLRFRFHGRVVHEVELPREGPTLELRRLDDVAYGRGIQMVEWSVSHPQGGEVTCLPLYYSEGRGWQPLSLPQRSSSVPVDFDALPGGAACRIRIMATDGAHTAVVESAPFAVQTKGYQAVILAPDDGAILMAGDTVTLAGQAFHWESPDVSAYELLWNSSLDGELGVGANVDAMLSPGDHLITLSLANEEGQPASVTLSVHPDPCGRPPRE